MVEITNEMRNQKKERIEKIEAKVDECIRKAVKNGTNGCYFPCDKEGDADVYDEVRSKYERAGYKIKPTGYIGGVWQKTEDIYW
jgi:hypothetical protein